MKGGGFLSPANTICFDNQWGFVEKVAMRTRNSSVSFGCIMPDAIWSNANSSPSGLVSTQHNPEADELIGMFVYACGFTTDFRATQTVSTSNFVQSCSLTWKCTIAELLCGRIGACVRFYGSTFLSLRKTLIVYLSMNEHPRKCQLLRFSLFQTIHGILRHRCLWIATLTYRKW